MQVAQRLGISQNYREVNIRKSVDTIIEGFLPAVEQLPGRDIIPTYVILTGNVKARVRMTTLYGLCGYLSHTNFPKRVRVIGTGNFSEDYIGYDTKGGDALADFFPIGSLFKSEVYQMLDHFVEYGILREEDIDRVPSAGLWDGQTDEGELGCTYAEMQTAIQYLIDDDLAPFAPVIIPDEKVVNMVAERHKNNKHKHEAPPLINLREFCDWRDEGGYFNNKE
jgi:NAD+ synthase